MKTGSLVPFTGPAGAFKGFPQPGTEEERRRPGRRIRRSPQRTATAPNRRSGA